MLFPLSDMWEQHEQRSRRNNFPTREKASYKEHVNAASEPSFRPGWPFHCTLRYLRSLLSEFPAQWIVAYVRGNISRSVKCGHQRGRSLKRSTADASTALNVTRYHCLNEWVKCSVSGEKKIFFMLWWRFVSSLHTKLIQFQRELFVILSIYLVLS